MQQQKWWQLVYADDLHLTCMGARKFFNLWMALLIYELLGTPFSYRKFSGGLKVQFLGYLLDYQECLIGITKRRGEWLVAFVEEMQLSKGFSCPKVSEGPAAGLHIHAHLQETENHSWRDFQNRCEVRDWSCGTWRNPFGDGGMVFFGGA